MASEQDFETDSPYFPSNSIIPQTILEDLCRLVRNYSSMFCYFRGLTFNQWLLFLPQPFLD